MSQAPKNQDVFHPQTKNNKETQNKIKVIEVIEAWRIEALSLWK